MAMFAVINHGKVVNKILADTKKTAEEVTGLTCVEFDDSVMVRIGATWDGTSFEELETDGVPFPQP